MWLFTKHGFISVVAFDPKKDREKRSKREVKAWGKHPMLVRARLREDIEQIRPFWSKLRVYEDKSADYAVRAVVPGSRLAEFLYFLTWDIDYNSHFKEVAEDNSPGGPAEGKRRHSAYMRCWSALAELQTTRPYGDSLYGTGYYSGSSAVSSGSEPAMAWSSIQQKMIPKTEKDAEDRINAARVAPVTNGAKTSIQPFDPYDIDEDDVTFSTVRSMCQELKIFSPKEIGEKTDIGEPATPYEVFDMWCAAEELFDTPLDLSDLLAVLYDLVSNPLTTPSACQKYTELIVEFEAELEAELKDRQGEIGIAEIVTVDGDPIPDGFDTILYSVAELLNSEPAVLSSPEAS